MYKKHILRIAEQFFILTLYATLFTYPSYATLELSATTPTEQRHARAAQPGKRLEQVLRLAHLALWVMSALKVERRFHVLWESLATVTALA